MSQPTAIRPPILSSSPRTSRDLSKTTVLAQAKQSPKIKLGASPHPQNQAIPAPTDVVTAICIKAPGTATRFTENNSLGEKCRPTPNISSMMPISDNCVAMSVSALNPGFAGPMTMPATKYPTNAGTLIFSARNPRHNAAIKAAAMVVMTVMLWSNSFSLCN